MTKIKVGGAALNQIPIHWENNRKNIEMAISQAKSQGIKILCLPELCLTGYGCEDLFLSNWVSEKAISMLPQIAELTKGIATTIGLPVRLESKTYNCVAVFEDGNLLGITAKQFLANDGVHYEPRWFTAWKPGEKIEIEIAGQKTPFGDLTYHLFGVHTGFEICEDAWRPERPACRMADKNIRLILNPSASHFALGKSYTRERLVVESSEKFNCYYIYANLLGNESGRMIYDGEIVIAGYGQILHFNHKLSFKDVNLVAVDIDPVDTKPVSIIHALPKENKHEIFTQAEALALFDYMRKSYSKGFVLSLSGGADSSTCAVLVSEMIRRSLDEIGAAFSEWKIDEEVNSYTDKIEKVIHRDLSWENDDITLQNIQSRARAPIIWMLANIKQSLLLVTSNRSEGDVGYATMDGDTSGSIAPIAAVDKYFILQWLGWAEMNLGYKSLSFVNSLNPTAELRPLEQSQTDEDDLMPYHVIVEIEKLAIRDKFSPKEVFQKLHEANLESPDLLKIHIKKFFTLWCRNQWKRERTAPAFHLDDFNVDPRTWCRFPILSSGYFDELAELDDL
jgi:NAD+ synthase (glutamine-hydrolysing)